MGVYTSIITAAPSVRVCLCVVRPCKYLLWMSVYYVSRVCVCDWCKISEIVHGHCISLLSVQYVHEGFTSWVYEHECAQMWLIQGRYEPFCSQVAFPTAAVDSGWQCQESRPGQATVKPHINLIYLCRSSSPDPATHSLSDEHAGKNTSLSCGRHKPMHTH